MAKAHTGLWIPISILHNEALTAIQKIILAEVLALQGAGGCFASNAHLARCAGVKERQLRNHLAALIGNGRLRVENGTSKRRRLWVSECLTSNTALDPDASIALAAAESAGNNGTELPQAGSETRQICAETSGMAQQETATQPGIKPTNPAGGCPTSRHENATENTVRAHKENTSKNTSIGGGIGIDIPEWLDPREWAYWRTSCEQRDFKVGPKLQEKQLAELGRLRAEGGDVGAIIRQSIQKDWKSFYPVPKPSSPPKRSIWAGVR